MNIKKTFAAALLMLVTACPTFAESSINEGAVESSAKECCAKSSTARDNWFINVAAGPQILFSDHDKQASLGDRISPALDIAVGKWFKPGIGVRVMYSGLKAKGATQHDMYSTGELIGTRDHGWTRKQEFNYCNVHADVMFNLSQLFDDTNINKRWASCPYLGAGIAHIYDSPKKNCASLNVGVYNTIRLCRALDATVDIRGMFVGDGFDGEKGERKGEGILSLSFGLAYNF